MSQGLDDILLGAQTRAYRCRQMAMKGPPDEAVLVNKSFLIATAGTIDLLSQLTEGLSETLEELNAK